MPVAAADSARGSDPLGGGAGGRGPGDLDSRAEEFIVEFSNEVARAGTGVDVSVDTVEPAHEVYVHCPELGWERVMLEAEDDGRIDWAAELQVPEDALTGRYEVLVVVRDAAGNRLERTLTLHVQGESNQ
jgi:Ca-activated chloride channel family protein